MNTDLEKKLNTLTNRVSEELIYEKQSGINNVLKIAHQKYSTKLSSENIKLFTPDSFEVIHKKRSLSWIIPSLLFYAVIIYGTIETYIDGRQDSTFLIGMIVFYSLIMLWILKIFLFPKPQLLAKKYMQKENSKILQAIKS